MNRLGAYIVIGLLFLFFLTTSAIAKLSYYYYCCKEELFPTPSPVQYLSSPYDTFSAENDISAPALAEF